MRVIYSKPAKDDIKKHAAHVRKVKKSDGHKYQDYEVKGINDTLKKRFLTDIGDKNDHSESIFPDKYDYGHSNYKMHIDKRSHYIVFYKVIKTKQGTEYASIEKCIHSIELRKELKDKDIKPLNNADPKLLLDYTTVEKEDKVKTGKLSDKAREEYNKKEDELKDRIAAKNKKKSKSNNDDEEEEMIDTKTGKKVKVTPAPPGPRGGPRVKVNGKIEYASNYKQSKGNKNESKSTLIPITEYLQNSKMKSLTNYIQENL